jgi:phenylpropionate dioxygenase-like ring-hydroxylating dioxygenase large terminal subunit
MQPATRSKETSVMNSLPRSLGTGVSDGAASRLLSRVDAPIEEATGLPNFAYTDEWFFAIERETVFGRNWCCAGFASDAPEPGDIRPFSFLGIPLLMVHGEDRLRVFHNVCSHRGATLVEQACKVRGAIRCPYHSWAYDLTGTLRATPSIGGANVNRLPGFSKTEHGLKEVHSAVWHDLVFINLCEDPVPFEDFIRPLESRWRKYDLSLFKGPAADSHFEIELAANWKLVVENTSESYHLPWVHPGLNSASRLEDHYHILGGDSYCGQGTRAYGNRSASNQRLPISPGISPEDAGQGEYITLFPNVQIGVHSDQLFHILIEPVSAQRTRERIALYYLEPAANSAEFAAFRRENVSWWRNIFNEDVQVVERLQRGRSSPAFEGGFFSSVMDVPTHHFHRWVARLAAAAVKPGQPRGSSGPGK